MDEEIPIHRRMRKADPGIKAEKKAAKRLGGRSIPASGSMDGVKGDIDLPKWLIESKSTTNVAMKLDRHWLEKIAHEALNRGKKPALVVQYVDIEGGKLGDSWVMIREVDFVELSECRSKEA